MNHGLADSFAALNRCFLTNFPHSDIFRISTYVPVETMARVANQIPFRYRSVDSAAGVTRETAKRLAEYLGVDETQVIHQALREMAFKLLPQYEADGGPLTANQVELIKKRSPQGTKRSVRSSLIE